MNRQNIRIERLGITPYKKTWEYQKSLQRSLIEGNAQQYLLLCEHTPVITLGKSAKESNILLSPAELESCGIDIFAIERGGDVTYHAPGQIVGYPILNLNNYSRDVGWYMRTLEEVIIQALNNLGVPSVRYEGRTGVWTEHSDDGSFISKDKIASIGVRLSRWCTMHGFAINILNQKKGFAYINPCGFTDVRITSVEQELRVQNLDEARQNALMNTAYKEIEKSFLDIF